MKNMPIGVVIIFLFVTFFASMTRAAEEEGAYWFLGKNGVFAASNDHQATKKTERPASGQTSAPTQADQTSSGNPKTDAQPTQTTTIISNDAAPVSPEVLESSPNDNQWLMYKRDPARNGFDQNNQTINSALRLLWSYTDIDFGQNKGPESSPVIKDNIVYLTTLAHSQYGACLLAFDLNNGTLLWHFTFGPSISAAVISVPVIDGNKIYAASWNGFLYAVDIQTGKEIWKTQLTQPEYRLMRSSPLVHEGVIYMSTLSSGNPGSYPPSLYAIDVSNGNILDQYELEAPGAYTSPMISSHKIYLATTKEYYQANQYSYLYRLDISNPGNLQLDWKVPFPYEVSTSVYHDGKLYCISYNELLMIEAETGTLFRRYTIDPFELSAKLASPSIAQGNIYIPSIFKLYSMNLEALNAGESNPYAVNWVADIKPFTDSYQGPFVGSSPSVANGYVFIEAGDMTGGRFFAMNTDNGQIEWVEGHERPMPLGGMMGMGYSTATPAISGNKVVFVSAHDMPWSGLFVYESIQPGGDFEGNVTINIADVWNKCNYQEVIDVDPTESYSLKNCPGPDCTLTLNRDTYICDYAGAQADACGRARILHYTVCR